MRIPIISTSSFPEYTLTPAAHRHFAEDRTGRFVGAYAATRLMAWPEKTVRFTFMRHAGACLWETDSRILVVGFVQDENEPNALNIYANYNAPLNSAGVFHVASCAVLGARSGDTRALNPMLVACAIQTLVVEAERQFKLHAFLET